MYNRLQKSDRDELHSYVVTVKTHATRIQVRDEMQYVDKYCDISNWISLSPVMIKEIKKHLTNLIDSGLGGIFYQ